MSDLDLPMLIVQAAMIAGSLAVGYILAQIGQRERVKKACDRSWYDGFIYACEKLKKPVRGKGGLWVKRDGEAVRQRVEVRL
jgi:hypothetical protein